MSIDPKNRCYFILAARAIYMRPIDGGDPVQKTRDLNVMLETTHPNITKADLGEMHHAVLQRLRTENHIEPSDVRDVVFLSVNLLGVMPPETFHGPAETPN